MPTSINIILPELGDGIKKAILAQWHVAPGDKIKSDEDVCEVVTDKASFSIQAGKSGVLKNILVSNGDEADIGTVLGVIDVQDD